MSLEVVRSSEGLRVVRRRSPGVLLGLALVFALFLSFLVPLMGALPTGALWLVLVLGALFTATRTEYRVLRRSQRLEVVTHFLGRQQWRSFPLGDIAQVKYERDDSGDGVTHLVRLYRRSGAPVSLTANSSFTRGKRELAETLEQGIHEFRRAA